MTSQKLEPCPRRFFGLLKPAHDYKIVRQTNRRFYVECSNLGCLDRYVYTFSNGHDIPPICWENVRQVVDWESLRYELKRNAESHKNCCPHCPKH